MQVTASPRTSLDHVGNHIDQDIDNQSDTWRNNPAPASSWEAGANTGEDDHDNEIVIPLGDDPQGPQTNIIHSATSSSAIPANTGGPNLAAAQAGPGPVPAPIPAGVTARGAAAARVFGHIQLATGLVIGGAGGLLGSHGVIKDNTAWIASGCSLMAMGMVLALAHPPAGRYQDQIANVFESIYQKLGY